MQRPAHRGIGGVWRKSWAPSYELWLGLGQRRPYCADAPLAALALLLVATPSLVAKERPLRLLLNHQLRPKTSSLSTSLP